jgi:flagellar basal-body rod modification protein FlgD
MSINALDAIGGTNAAMANASVAGSNTISQANDQFMMILLAQLKNQNPMEPMKDNELMAQMTQLNSLQELQAIKAKMEQLAASSSAGYAASLIGKKVVALLSDGTTVEGQVTGTTFRQGLYMLNVDDQLVLLSSILEVKAEEPAPAPVVQTPAGTTPIVPEPESPVDIISPAP